ncbi:MAG: RecX family transcriptional regulator [Bacteroidales bacterium]|jgi:regulatory protein|nr:RecX family transcriptional regulator [Bacteroidales bacterium]
MNRRSVNRNLQNSPGTGAEGKLPVDFLVKIESYCAFRERYTGEVIQKLKSWKLPSGKISTIMKHLREAGFIDDERFARAFVRGKFRNNRWGRQKIRFELKGRRIPEKLIDHALKEIGEEEYEQTIHTLILKKQKEIKAEKTLNIREKIINFVTGKGFELDLVLRMMTEE